MFNIYIGICYFSLALLCWAAAGGNANVNNVNNDILNDDNDVNNNRGVRPVISS